MFPGMFRFRRCTGKEQPVGPGQAAGPPRREDRSMRSPCLLWLALAGISGLGSPGYQPA